VDGYSGSFVVIFLVALSLNCLSTSACVSFFVFVSQQTHLGLNLLYEHHTLSHQKKYIIRHFLKFSLYCVLVLCRMQDYTIGKSKRNLTKPFIFQQISIFVVHRLKSHSEDNVKITSL